MNIFSNFFGSRKDSGEITTLSILRELMRRGNTSKSGKTVNVDSAFQVGAFFDGLRVIGEGVAQVPFRLMQEVDDPASVLPQRRPAKDHPLDSLVRFKPNDWQDSFQFRETLVMQAAMLGNSCNFINRVGTRSNMRVAEIIPLPANRVTCKQLPDKSLAYTLRSETGQKDQTFPQEAIWHIRGPSWDGVNGLNVLKLATDALGLAMATEESHSKLHKHGVNPSGIYTVEGKLSPTAYGDLKKWIEDEFSGLQNAGKPMVLDQNAKFVPSSMTGVDAQHLETRRYQLEEICRFLRIMPIMIGHSDKAATYASAEQMFLAHLVHCLMPWYARIEQSANASLLTETERKQGYYFKFFERALLRGAMKDTSEYLTKLKGAGIITANEARADLDRNPLENGDTLTTTGAAPEADPNGEAPKDPNATPEKN